MNVRGVIELLHVGPNFQAFTGLGFAVILTLFFHSVCDLGVITWSAQATYLLFGRLQEIPDNFFYSKYDFCRKI